MTRRNGKAADASAAVKAAQARRRLAPILAQLGEMVATATANLKTPALATALKRLTPDDPEWAADTLAEIVDELRNVLVLLGLAAEDVAAGPRTVPSRKP